MTRVLHVFGAMDVGGAEMRTLELMRAIREDGVEFQFLTLSGRPGVLEPEIAALGGRIYPMRLQLTFPLRYLRLLRASRPDVLDSHVATFSGVLIAGAWLARVPRRIAHFRSDGDGQSSTRMRRIQRRLMVGLIGLFATDIVGVSPSALTDGYRSDWRNDTRARVIPNGLPPYVPSASVVDLRDEIGARNGELIVMHVGRPSPEKNRVWTVSILAALRQRGVDARLVLLGGTGVDTEPLRLLAADLGVAAETHDLGARRPARDYMAQADVLVLTSVREGLPGVVLEALSVGAPVVSSDLPGVRYVSKALRGVTVLNLDQPASEWGDAIWRAYELSRSPEWQDSLRRDFEDSQFFQARSMKEHLAMYEAR